MHISGDIPSPDNIPNYDNNPVVSHNNEKVSTFSKDNPEYKNEDQLEREKVNEELKQEMGNQELKKPNKIKMFFYKLFGKKPKNPEYDYNTNPPPYDK